MSASGWRTAALRVLLFGAGAVAARTALSVWRGGPRPPGSLPTPWQRTNFRGSVVSLVGGPSLAATAAVAAAVGAPDRRAAAAALTAGLGAGSVGLYDDLVGGQVGQPGPKGFHGHLSALRRGELTSGIIKIAGVGAAGLVAASLLESSRPTPAPTPAHTAAAVSRSWGLSRVSRGASRESAMINASGASGRRRMRRSVNVGLGAGVIAGAANLVNLLDLRPGRALKVGLLAGLPLATGAAGGLAAGPVGACAGLLPADLDEQIMLGDGGANALGALLGVALVARTGPLGRAAALALIAALTAASEKVSFTRVIAATPVLREIDNLGRRPDPATDGD